jgi:DNA-binding transcriptional LysR family regulator
MTMPRNINLHLLQHLKALITEKHVSRAAASLGIGQPAMSASLARLRKQLKDPLLVRTVRGMEPTPYALKLAKSVQQAMDIMDEAIRENEQFNASASTRHFRIISSDGVAQLILPGLAAIAMREAPRMKLSWLAGDVRRAGEALREGEADLIVSNMRSAPDDLLTVSLYPQRIVCIARRNHPKIRGSLSLDQFTALPHVVFASSPQTASIIDNIVDAELESMGMSRQVTVQVPSFLVSPSVVAGTDMLACVPERIALANAAGMNLQVLQLPFDLVDINLSMCWHTRVHRDPAHIWLRSAMKKAIHDGAKHH